MFSTTFRNLAAAAGFGLVALPALAVAQTATPIQNLDGVTAVPIGHPVTQPGCVVPINPLGSEKNSLSPVCPNVILEETFDDPAQISSTWGFPTLDWQHYFASDGAGGFAIYMGDEGGGTGNGQTSGGSSNGPSFPLTSGSGGGFDDAPWYSTGYFRFDLALEAAPGYSTNTTFWVFRLEEPNLRLELNIDDGVWSYRIARGNTVTSWTALPADTVASTVEIDFLAGSDFQQASFEVRWEARNPRYTWNHTSVMTMTDSQPWSHFAFGLNIYDTLENGGRTSGLQAASGAEKSSEDVIALMIDNFGAYRYSQDWN